MDADNWKLLAARKRSALNFRTIEYHEYGQQGSLDQPNHYDEGSLITMDIMLSTPGKDFEGGSFVAPLADGNFMQPQFCKGDAIFFVSHKFHNILPITSGNRVVLVAELWEGAEKECAHRCESEGKWRRKRWCEAPDEAGV